eukprot:Polyplicarium_translucidae@DN3271_c0_g1_i2.p1
MRGGFPASSSHLQKWLWRDEAEVARLRAEANRAAREALVDVVRPEEFPTPAEEEQLANYFAGQLIRFCAQKKLEYKIANTALAYFKRFFLMRSAIEFDPRKVLFVCVIIAIKTEEQGNALTLQQLTEGLAGQIDVADIMRLELPVLDAIDFDLAVLHCRTPLHYLTTDYYQTRKEGMSEEDADRLDKTVREIYAAAEKLSTELSRSNIPFIYSPSQIAIAVFQRCAHGRLLDAYGFCEKLFENHPSLWEKLKVRVHECKTRMVVFEESVAQLHAAEEEQKAAFLIKKLERITKKQRRSLATGDQAERRKRRRKTEPSTPSESPQPADV